MGKAGRNEMKKVAAGFLNGAAIAILVSRGVAPAIEKAQWALSAFIAVSLSLTLHILALAIVRKVKD